MDILRSFLFVGFFVFFTPSYLLAYSNVTSCQKAGKAQICQVEGKIGSENNQISAYNKGKWVGSGRILSSSNHSTKILIEESFSPVKAGFAILNTSADEYESIKFSYTKSDDYR